MPIAKNQLKTKPQPPKRCFQKKSPSSWVAPCGQSVETIRKSLLERLGIKLQWGKVHPSALRNNQISQEREKKRSSRKGGGQIPRA